MSLTAKKVNFQGRSVIYVARFWPLENNRLPWSLRVCIECRPLDT